MKIKQSTYDDLIIDNILIDNPRNYQQNLYK